MQSGYDGAAEIVIPTGRNGFCCIVPCALLVALYSGAATGLAALAWRCARHLRKRDATK